MLGFAAGFPSAVSKAPKASLCFLGVEICSSSELRREREFAGFAGFIAIMQTRC